MGCCGQATPDVEWTVTWTDGTSTTFANEQLARVAATKSGTYIKIAKKS